MKAYINVYDEKGKLVKRKKANSLVRQFIQLLNVQMAQTNRSIIDVTNSSRTISYNSISLSLVAGAGDANYGVWVGTGTNPVSINDVTLQSKIAHGTGTGQLVYGATSVGVPVVVGSKAVFYVSRTFTNNSGADITVNEVGLVACGGPGPYYFLIDRTLLSVTIPNGESRTFQYEISVVV